MPPPAFDGTERPEAPSGVVLARGAFTEFLAMTLFVFFGCGAAASNAKKDESRFDRFDSGSSTGGAAEWDPAATSSIALQFGLGITVLAYFSAHSSGGHINCAVTWALVIVGKCHPIQGLVYLVAQLLGSITGALFLKGCTRGAEGDGSVIDRTGGLGANGFQNDSVTTGGAFVAEMMGTMLLVLVVLETAVNGNALTTEGNKPVAGNKLNLAPIPIGLAVFLAHMVLIPITGCSINPTRSFGPSLVAGSWDHHWIWWIAPLLGATVGAMVWGVMMALAIEDANAPAAKPKQDKEDLGSELTVVDEDDDDDDEAAED